MHIRLSFVIAVLSLSISASPLWAQETGSSEAADPAEAVGQLTRKPELIKQVEATYPPDLFKSGVTGAVVLRITIDATGTVSEALVENSSGHSAMDEAAMEAVLQFSFSPAEIDGQPAPVQILYRYGFTIEQEAVTVPVAPETPTGALTGLVLQKGTRAPLPGFIVRLIKHDREAVTDSEGRFRFDDVPAGAVIIELDDEDHYVTQDEEIIEVGKETSVKYYIEPKGLGDNTVTVIGRRVRKDVARRTVTMQEIRKIPGTSGDALKVVQNLPGVARIPFGGGGLIIRGSNPGDSGAVIGGHFVPIPFHFGGLRSVVPSELIESVEFYPGNFGAEYGRYTGGLVDVRLRRPRDDRWGGRIEADVFDAGFFLEGPLGDHTTVAIGGRRSYLDVILNAVIPDGDDSGFNLTVAPRYYDYQLGTDLKFGRHRLRTFILGSDDALEFVLKAPPTGAPELRGDFINEVYFYRGYLDWQWSLTDAMTHRFSTAVGKNVGRLSFGPDIYASNEVWVVTVRDELTTTFNPDTTLRVGVDFQGLYGSLDLRLPLPPKEGGARGAGRSFSTLEFLETERKFILQNPALWTELQLKLLNDRLLLIPGFRLEYDVYLEDYAPDPRLSARYILVPDSTTLKAGVGMYAQRPGPDETDPEFGDPEINFEHSVQASIGFEQALGERFELDVVGFYKHLYEMVSPIAQTNLDDVLSGEPDRRLTNEGTGRAYGLEVLLRHNPTQRFFGWISYTLMRSERKDAGSDTYRLFDFDQTHILSVLGQYRITNEWEIGARFRYVSGIPQTPFVGSIYNSDSDSYEGIVGEINSTRMPAFHSLDLRVDRNWIFDEWLLTAYFEIRNVYNHENVEGLDYNYNYTEKRYQTGLPIIPSLGIRGEF